jgi:hypothetical protein
MVATLTTNKNSPSKKRHCYELPVLGLNQTDTFLGGFGGHLIFMNIPSKKKRHIALLLKKKMR